MLNLFPSLLTYGGYGPTIIRVVLGLIFLDLGILKLRSEKARWIASFEALHLKPAVSLVTLFGTVEAVGGLMLIGGVYTQAAALVFALLTGVELYLEWKDASLIKRSFVFYLLLFAIALSLLFTGAGKAAFDIPL